MQLVPAARLVPHVLCREKPKVGKEMFVMLTTLGLLFVKAIEFVTVVPI